MARSGKELPERTRFGTTRATAEREGTEREGTERARAPAHRAGPKIELREGSRLRNRFELIEKLGEGGMGAVWKGVDLLKVEARDRNPYVAIKLLQGDFRDHPEAFVALQRESAKQQRLAHPNIATVFDFDRDTGQDLVFMTMEVLEGQSLDTFIQSLPPGGLDLDAAMPIIEQLADGLEHAHQNNLVHSDLKPGNCFLAADGTVKLLDFGIARASKTQSDAEGEHTLFDPSALGALTPAYATVEMFEGEDPAPSDDVFALAVMSYELLTGEHPLGGENAPVALETGLAPRPVSKLGRRQNRALRRALALRRKHRTPTVRQLVDGLRPAPRRRRIALTAILAAGALLVAAGYPWVGDHIRRGSDTHTIELLEGTSADFSAGLERLRANGGRLHTDAPELLARARAAMRGHLVATPQRQAPEVLATFAGLEPQWRETVLGDETVRDALVEAGRRRMRELFSPAEGRLDHGAAARVVAGLERVFPGSALVATLASELEAERVRAVQGLDETLRALLSGPGGAVAEAELAAGLDTLRRLAPGHERLTSGRERERLLETARRAARAGETARADLQLAAAEQLGADAAAVASLRRALQAWRAEGSAAARTERLRERLEASRSSLTTLGDFELVRLEMDELASLAPGEPVLRALGAELERLLAPELAARVDRGEPALALDLLVRYAALTRLDFVVSQRDAIWRAMPGSANPGAASSGDSAGRARVTALAERATTVNSLLARPELTVGWSARFDPAFKEYVALARPGNPDADRVRAALGWLHADRAQEMLDGGQTAAAGRLAAQGLAYAPGNDRLQALREALLRDERARAQPRADPGRRPAGAEEPDPAPSAGSAAPARASRGMRASASRAAQAALPPPERPGLPLEGLPRAQALLELGRLEAAGAALARARSSGPPSSKMARLRHTLAKRRDAALAAYEAYAFDMRAGTVPDPAERARRLESVKALWSDNPDFVAVAHVDRPPDACWAGLAGLGRRHSCQDWIAPGVPGPRLVVVPGPETAGGQSEPFAITQHEITVAEFRRYCDRHPDCGWQSGRSGADDELPVTGVDLAAAEGYAAWLSDRTSARAARRLVYRLPTRAEWRRAAAAGGRPERRGLNCRPDAAGAPALSISREGSRILSSSAPLGQGLLRATVGEANAFGVVNALGNAREPVRTPSGLLAAGGSFRDRASICTAELAVAYDGEPDGVTGLRLVRELGAR